MIEEWFTLEDIEKSDNTDKLYCISVDSPEKQFLAGKIGVPTHNTEQGKEEDSMKGEANMIIGSIARLGRAAGVHLIIATQRPDASILPGETKANLGVRINCGRTMGSASQMILENGEGQRVKANPRGRLYLKIFGNGDHGQGFFAKQEWYDNYLEKNGLNPDGTPISPRMIKSQEKDEDLSILEGDDLDNLEGVDRSESIRISKEEEAEGDFASFLEEIEDEDWSSSNENDDLDDMDEEDSEVEGTVEEERDDRPKLKGSNKNEDQWHRPEDDWDSEFEELIRENNA